MRTREDEWHKPRVIGDNTANMRTAVCSVCGDILTWWLADKDIGGIISNYCPNCGARLAPNKDCKCIPVNRETSNNLVDGQYIIQGNRRDEYAALQKQLNNAFFSNCDIKIVAVPKLTDLAKQVKAYRTKHSLSQEQLADKAGLSRWTVINIEQGKSCSITTREAILEAIRDDRN